MTLLLLKFIVTRTSAALLCCFWALSTELRLTLLQVLQKALVSIRKSAMPLITVLSFFGFVTGPFVSTAAAPHSEALPQSFLTSEGIKVPAGPIDHVAEVRKFNAVVTQYSYADSCHNVVDGKCLMASGKPVYVGAIACPRYLALGTKVKIDETVYICEDRYATWLDSKRGRPTIDVFVKDNPKGNGIKQVAIVR